MIDLNQLIEEAETHEEPEVSDKPQEDPNRDVPDKVNIDKHRREDQGEGD